jgi:hypothetical protein
MLNKVQWDFKGGKFPENYFNYCVMTALADTWVVTSNTYLIFLALITQGGRNIPEGLDKVPSLRSETISKFVFISDISKTIW